MTLKVEDNLIEDFYCVLNLTCSVCSTTFIEEYGQVQDQPENFICNSCTSEILEKEQKAAQKALDELLKRAKEKPEEQQVKPQDVNFSNRQKQMEKNKISNAGWTSKAKKKEQKIDDDVARKQENLKREKLARKAKSAAKSQMRNKSILNKQLQQM